MVGLRVLLTADRVIDQLINGMRIARLANEKHVLDVRRRNTISDAVASNRPQRLMLFKKVNAKQKSSQLERDRQMDRGRTSSDNIIRVAVDGAWITRHQQ